MICRNAARHALMLHQWMVAPDFDEEGEVQKAGQRFVGNAAPAEIPRLATAHGMHALARRRREIQPGVGRHISWQTLPSAGQDRPLRTPRSRLR
jgi:hypothetical protein